MDPVDLIGTIVIGFCAGALGGLVGVGGGILFVPGLVIFLGLSQLDAEATSLLAVVLVGLVGAWRQYGYGNLRIRDGLVLGALAPLGVLGGTVLANSVSERALELAFAALQLYFAWGLVARAVAAGGEAGPDTGPASG